MRRKVLVKIIWRKIKIINICDLFIFETGNKKGNLRFPFLLPVVFSNLALILFYIIHKISFIRCNRGI